MLRQFFIIVVALILAACTSRNVREVDGVLVVDVCEVREGENIPVETLAESVEVIPLETVDGAFFEFAGAAMSEKFAVVRAANGLVRVFGRDGRFVGLLEGVDERREVYDIAIDEGRGAIYASTICGDRLLVFDLRGCRKPDIILQSCTNKVVLAADSCGIVLAQFDFTDMPSGFNAAIIGKESTCHTSRPSLCTSLRNTSGTATGFNHDIFGSRTGGQLRFMTSFCDTLFRYDTKENRIVPELAVNLPVHSDINPSGSMPDSTLKERWLTITALPCHYIVHISGADAQRIIVDRKQRTAQKATITGIDSLRLYFTDSYAYSFLPPNGRENCTLIRWKLSDNPNHKPAPKPDIPQSKNTPVEWDTNAALTALDL